jgi:two-component system phosphate regulon sensor histidine kinase PhoR
VRGSGIGLALVKHIAESHQGKVRVVSPTQPDGRGTTFVIEVPAIGGLATPRAPAP